MVAVVGLEEESSEERDSFRDLRVSSSFFSRAASSAATRDAMWSSRAWAREALVWIECRQYDTQRMVGQNGLPACAGKSV